MKLIKKFLTVSLCVLIISSLINNNLFSLFIIRAISENQNDQYKIDSYNIFTWSWSISEVVSTESKGSSSSSSLAVDSAGNVYIAWRDVSDYSGSGTDSDIIFKRWDNSTLSWTTAEVVSTESTEDTIEPFLAIDSAKNVHIAWQEATDYGNSGSDTDIFYKRWDSSSSSWTTTEVVSSESSVPSTSVSMDVDNLGNVYLSWIDLIQNAYPRDKTRKHTYHFRFKTKGLDIFYEIRPFFVEKGEECDLAKISDNRWWTGGLASVHVVLGKSQAK